MIKWTNQIAPSKWTGQSSNRLKHLTRGQELCNLPYMHPIFSQSYCLKHEFLETLRTLVDNLVLSGRPYHGRAHVGVTFNQN